LTPERQRQLQTLLQTYRDSKRKAQLEPAPRAPAAQIDVALQAELAADAALLNADPDPHAPGVYDAALPPPDEVSRRPAPPAVEGTYNFGRPLVPGFPNIPSVTWADSDIKVRAGLRPPSLDRTGLTRGTRGKPCLDGLRHVQGQPG
jgi:hypothetical protein